MKKIVIASTGASGAIYLERFLRQFPNEKAQGHLVISDHAKSIIKIELGSSLSIPDHLIQHSNKNLSARIASGSFVFDAMVIIPASMGSVARIASGFANDLISRTADVALKEKRRLIILPREMPLNDIHLANLSRLSAAGAIIAPTTPSFYLNPRGVIDLVDTVVHRVFDLIGLPIEGAKRWQGSSIPEKEIKKGAKDRREFFNKISRKQGQNVMDEDEDRLKVRI